MARMYRVTLELRRHKRDHWLPRWRIVSHTEEAYSASDAGYQARLRVSHQERCRVRVIAVAPAEGGL